MAILNTVTRERVYGHLMPPIRAGQLSMVIGLCLSGLYIWLLTGVVPIMSGRFALLIGGVWFVMAMALESLDLFVAGRFWSQSLRHYDLFAAKLWALILLWTWALRLP